MPPRRVEMGAARSRPDDLLLIAAREPVPGTTKTRLGATIGMERAAILYEAFLRDLADRFVVSARSYRVGWAYSPPECDFPRIAARVAGPAASENVLFVPQSGPDWGARQVNLLRWAHESGFGRTVLIASDSPHLPSATVEAAFAALASAEVVIGPVHDGGYYLIGVHGPHDVLSGVPMSTKDAAAAIRIRARKAGLRVADLCPTFDVDVAEDLELLRHELARCPAIAPATNQALHELELMDRWSGLGHLHPAAAHESPARH
jgi:rSAM/selenodomain-associated transferase 1